MLHVMLYEENILLCFMCYQFGIKIFLIIPNGSFNVYSEVIQCAISNCVIKRIKYLVCVINKHFVFVFGVICLFASKHGGIESAVFPSELVKSLRSTADLIPPVFKANSSKFIC